MRMVIASIAGLGARREERGVTTMNAACPVALRTVDEHTARLTAGIVTVLMTAIILGPFKWLALVLAADFIMRGFARKRSPLCSVAQYVLRTMKVAPQPVDAGPKKFASRIGFGMSLLAGLAGLAGLPIASMVFGGILVFCAFLEAAFGLCLGCKMYSLLPHPVLDVPEPRRIA